jgi:hypothetical protein
MLALNGEVVVHGMNFRVYDAARKFWNIKWLDAALYACNIHQRLTGSFYLERTQVRRPEDLG